MKGKIHRQILDQLGTDDDNIGGLDVDIGWGDLWILVPGLLLGVVAYEAASAVTGVFGPGIVRAVAPYHPALVVAVQLIGQLLAALAGFACLVAAGFVIVMTPEGRTPIEWAGDVWSFRRRAKELSPFAETEAERPESLTQIDRFHREAGAVERVDGTFVAAVEVEPANMALATDDEWDRVADDFGSALNALTFPTQIRTSARPVDPDDITAPYAARRDDADVRETPALANIIDVYRRRLPDEFDAKGTSVRDYHILVPVSPTDVQLDEQGATGRLGNIDVRVVGDVLETVVATRSGLDDVELQSEQRAELAERLGDVREAVDGVDGCRAGAVGVDDMARLAEEFWSGERTEYDDGAEVDRLRSFPVVLPGNAADRD